MSKIYNVAMEKTVYFNIKADNEDQVMDWMNTHSIEEDAEEVEIHYDDRIIEEVEGNADVYVDISEEEEEEEEDDDADGTFKSAEEMLEYIQAGHDLYDQVNDTYVFVYNDAGSIAVYDWIDNDYAAKLAEKDEYWGAYLGPGGDIYEDPSHEDYDEDYGTSNLEWCEDHYKDGWMDCDGYLDWYKKNNIAEEGRI